MRRADSRVLWAIAFVLFGLGFIEPMWLLRDLGGDDSSYFAHAETIGLDFDLDYSNEPVRRWNRDGTMAAHPIGAGLLAAPVVAVAAVVDRAQGHAVIRDHREYRYSWALFGFFLAAVGYFVLGVGLYRDALRVVWPALDPRLNLLLAMSTGVPFYVLRRFTMSHAFEFASGALAFWAAVGLYRALSRQEPARRWLVWSALAAFLNLAVRVNNLNMLVLPHAVLLLLFVFGAPALPRPDWTRVRAALLRVSVAVAAGFAPFGAFNWIVYGTIYPSPARMYGRALTGTADRTAFQILGEGVKLVPNLVPLVFSSEFGLLYTNPVLVIGGSLLLGLLVARMVRKPDVPHVLALLSVLLFFGLSMAIVLWWQTTGTSYGYRYLMPLYPIALLGVAIAATASSMRGLRFRRALLPALVALAGVSVVSQTFFSANEALEVRPQVNVFGVRHNASARGYLTRLPVQIVQPSTWVSLASRRMAGFLAGPAIMSSPGLRARLPDSYVAAYERLYRPAPARVYVQLLLILAAWTAGGCCC